MPPRVLIFAARPGDRYRVGRTARALTRLGLSPRDVSGLPGPALAEQLTSSPEPVWLVRAVAWLPATAVTFPPPSATGRPLAALGMVRPAGVATAADPWPAIQAKTGGDLTGAPAWSEHLPGLASVYLEAEPASHVAVRLREGPELVPTLAAELDESRYRLIRLPGLDVFDDPGLRVLQVVTSLQQGGAERVARSLTEELRRQGTQCLLATLGRPTRTALPIPAGTLDLSRLGEDRAARAEQLGRAACEFGADVVHAHLLDGEDIRRLAAQGVPLVVTIHNVRPGWPDGLTNLGAADAALLIACSRAVESELRAAAIPVPVRTVWNGIDLETVRPTPARSAAARELRHRCGFGAEDVVLLALANPRPQKRLPLLPAVLAATQAELKQRGDDRPVRLLMAGELSRANATAARVVEEVGGEVARLGLTQDVRWTRPGEDVAAVLAAADVLVSTSAYEGLSLAQLEALAAGLPVVATDVGGAAELTGDGRPVFLVPPDSAPEQFARQVADVLGRENERGPAALAPFTQARMTARCHWLYARALEAARGPRRPEGLLLVSNNFSTGGAQSSARRLLTGLAAEGVRVRAAVLQEQPDWPTPGRKALAAAGVPVLALPPAGSRDAAEAVAMLLERLDGDPPRAVLLWNALAEYKLLLADALFDVPVYDVSPGEMYYTSLERYFAKPRPGLPYRNPAEYGERLAGVIVKYQAEAARAAATLRAPVHIIPNGVPVAEVPPHTGGGPLLIGTAARINPDKKLEHLLDAMRRAHPELPPYRLRIAGGVEPGCEAYAEELRRLSAGLPVEWCGALADTQAFLAGLDFFALVAEPAGCPNASLEAMAAGLAVVATDVGGAAEQVSDGVTGRVVPRGDPAALAAALVEMARDPDRRAAWGAAGRRRVREQFSVERMTADYRRTCLG